MVSLISDLHTKTGLGQSTKGQIKALIADISHWLVIHILMIIISSIYPVMHILYKGYVYHYLYYIVRAELYAP